MYSAPRVCPAGSVTCGAGNLVVGVVLAGAVPVAGYATDRNAGRQRAVPELFLSVAGAGAVAGHGLRTDDDR
jgi:hypothetical protein